MSRFCDSIGSLPLSGWPLHPESPVRTRRHSSTYTIGCPCLAFTRATFFKVDVSDARINGEFPRYDWG